MRNQSQTRLRLRHAPVCADNVHFITEASLMLLYDTSTSGHNIPAYPSQN